MNEWFKGGEGGDRTVALEKFIKVFHFIGAGLFKVQTRTSHSFIYLFSTVHLF